MFDLLNAVVSEPVANPTNAKSSVRIGFPQHVKDVVGVRSFSWKSRLLRKEPLRTAADLQATLAKIVNKLSDSKSALTKQTNRFLKNRDVRSFFLSVSDAILPFTPDYHALLQILDEKIPKDATIADYFGGSGNLSLYLLLQSENRQVSFYEKDTAAHESAFRKLAGMAVTDGIPSNMRDAFMLGFPQTRLETMGSLKGLASMIHLKGRIFVLSFSKKARDEEQMKKWLVDTGRIAVEYGAPLTDFDFALFAAILLKPSLWRKDDNGWWISSSGKKFQNCLQDAGFALASRHSVLGGMVQVLELKLT